MALKALAFNCTLKSSPQPSSTEKLLRELLDALARAVNYDIKPGVSADEAERSATVLRDRELLDRTGCGARRGRGGDCEQRERRVFSRAT
jgi:hypothetical protein